MSYYKSMNHPATIVDFGLTPEQEDHARDLHNNLIVFDSLMECTWYEGLIDNIRRGGHACGSLSIGTIGLESFQGKTENISFQEQDWWSGKTLLSDIAFVNAKARENSSEIAICYTADDLRQAKKDDRIGFMLDVQNTEYIGKNLDNIELFYNLGLRRSQLTYNSTVAAGAGCMEKSNRGLSNFGRDMIARMNDIGMLVDTGHCHSSTLMDAIDASDKPIACSHAGMASRCNNPRTQTDEALKNLADSGGVFGIVSTPGAINGTDKCSVKDYVDTIDAAVNLMGVEHVGFGSDFVLAASVEEILSAPEWTDKLREAVGVNVQVWPWSDGHIGMENNSGYPNLTRGLLAKGYSDADITKIMGGNFIRLIEDTIG